MRHARSVALHPGTRSALIPRHHSNVRVGMPVLRRNAVAVERRRALAVTCRTGKGQKPPTSLKGKCWDASTVAQRHCSQTPAGTFDLREGQLACGSGQPSESYTTSISNDTGGCRSESRPYQCPRAPMPHPSAGRRTPRCRAAHRRCHRRCRCCCST